MFNTKLILAYDGTHYQGWQKTLTGPSIEGALQQILEKILQQPIKLQAASRTDAGVHARGQVVNFFTNTPILDLNRFQISLKKLLPEDIVILSSEHADPDFHPTLSNFGKEYHYDVCNGRIQLPSNRHFSWHYWYPINVEEMRSAAQKLIGVHNFAAFTNVMSEPTPEDTTREIYDIQILELEGNRLRFIIKGKSFLYKMVRNIVGTLLYVGRGKISVENIDNLLKGGCRTKGGITAPAHGLTLHQVLSITLAI